MRTELRRIVETVRGKKRDLNSQEIQKLASCILSCVSLQTRSSWLHCISAEDNNPNLRRAFEQSVVENSWPLFEALHQPNSKLASHAREFEDFDGEAADNAASFEKTLQKFRDLREKDPEFSAIVGLFKPSWPIKNSIRVPETLFAEVQKAILAMKEKDIQTVKQAVSQQDDALFREVSQALDTHVNGPGEINFEFAEKTISNFWFNNKDRRSIDMFNAKDLAHYTMVEVLQRRASGAGVAVPSPFSVLEYD